MLCQYIAFLCEQIGMSRDMINMSDFCSVSGSGITQVGAAMLGDWLAINTSLMHLEYVL
jgi:hypothetical protein